MNGDDSLKQDQAQTAEPKANNPPLMTLELRMRAVENTLANLPDVIKKALDDHPDLASFRDYIARFGGGR